MIYCTRCLEEVNDLVREMKPDILVKKICDYLNLPVGWVISNSRKREYSEARHIICDMLYHDMHLTQKEIGELLGGRDHTTVINSINAIKRWCFDTHFRENYLKLHKAIYGHTRNFRYDDNFYKKNKVKRKKMGFYLDRI